MVFSWYETNKSFVCATERHAAIFEVAYCNVLAYHVRMEFKPKAF